MTIDAILLAAGYGTRLYPLTKDRPKALLPLGDGTIMDALAEDLAKIPGLSRVALVTNSRFADLFRQWVATQPHKQLKIEVIDDGTSSNETRLGAIRDLLLGLERLPGAKDVLVLGTDNLFGWPLSRFVEAAQRRSPHAMIAVHEVATLEEATRMGVVRLAPDGKIVECLEKPKQPPARTVSLAVYFFPEAMHVRFREFLDQGGNPDAPGFFLEWLVRTEPVYTFLSEGEWLDIGSHETYEQAKTWWSARRRAEPADPRWRGASGPEGARGG